MKNSTIATSNPSHLSLAKIEDLPRGQILGVAVFSETFWFDKSKHLDNEWNLGPFCYKIIDVFRFEHGIDALGQLGIWTPKEAAYDAIQSMAGYNEKINEWKQRFGDNLYFGKNERQIPSAITILQPFVEAILCGLKDVENRKRPFFKLHPNKLMYKHPIAPKQTQCRFCPNINLTDDANVKQQQCVYWAHAKESNSRNRRGSKALTPTPVCKQSDSESIINNESNDTDGDETSVYYSSDENGKIEYKTRGNVSRKRKRDQIEKKTNECKLKSGSMTEKKVKKRTKKRKKKKRKYDKQKWQSTADYLIHDDGVVPFRMCYHGQIMQPCANPNNPKECQYCDDDIGEDHYYSCNCKGYTCNHCFHHTVPLKLDAPTSWKNVLGPYKDMNARKEVIKSMHKIAKSFKRRKHRVIDEKSDDIDHSVTPKASFVEPLVNEDALNKINMDFMRNPVQKKKEPLVQIPCFEVPLNAESVGNSIDVVIKKKQQISLNHSMQPIATGSLSSNVPHFGNIFNGQCMQQQQAMNGTAMLSLGQILSATPNIMPVPSPFTNTNTNTLFTADNTSLSSLINNNIVNNNHYALNMNMPQNNSLLSVQSKLCNMIPSITQIAHANANDHNTDSSTSTITQTQSQAKKERQSIWANCAYSSSSSSDSNTPQKNTGYDISINPFKKQANVSDVMYATSNGKLNLSQFISQNNKTQMLTVPAQNNCNG